MNYEIQFDLPLEVHCTTCGKVRPVPPVDQLHGPCPGAQIDAASTRREGKTVFVCWHTGKWVDA